MWLRVCSNDHAPFTVRSYIFFFKIKNCLNDDLFISCNDRIGKMLHNICISAVAMSLRWATRGPWASCFFICDVVISTIVWYLLITWLSLLLTLYTIAPDRMRCQIENSLILYENVCCGYPLEVLFVLMSTHTIYFRGARRKISKHFCWKCTLSEAWTQYTLD